MSIELVPLATATLKVKEQFVLPNGPFGTRIVAEVAGTRYDGDRLTATQKGSSAADWALLAPDGTATLDVRHTVETEDGALIYVSYRGKMDCSQGIGSAPAYAAPLFETGDERYGWLNGVQAVAKGRIDGDTVTYEIYEIK